MQKPRRPFYNLLTSWIEWQTQQISKSLYEIVMNSHHNYQIGFYKNFLIIFNGIAYLHYVKRITQMRNM